MCSVSRSQPEAWRLTKQLVLSIGKLQAIVGERGVRKFMPRSVWSDCGHAGRDGFLSLASCFFHCSKGCATSTSPILTRKLDRVTDLLVNQLLADEIQERVPLAALR